MSSVSDTSTLNFPEIEDSLIELEDELDKKERAKIAEEIYHYRTQLNSDSSEDMLGCSSFTPPNDEVVDKKVFPEGGVLPPNEDVLSTLDVTDGSVLPLNEDVFPEDRILRKRTNKKEEKEFLVKSEGCKSDSMTLRPVRERQPSKPGAEDCSEPSEDDLFQTVKRRRIIKPGNLKEEETRHTRGATVCNQEISLQKVELMLNGKSVGVEQSMTPEAISDTFLFTLGNDSTRYFYVKWKEMDRPEWVKEQIPKARFPSLVIKFYEDERARRQIRHTEE